MDSLSASTHYFIEAWRFFSERIPRGTFERLPGIAAAFGRIPMPFLNMIFLDSPTRDREDLNTRLQRAAEYGNRSALPWFLALCKQWVGKDYEEALGRQQLIPVMQLRAMKAESLSNPRRPLARLEYPEGPGRAELARWIAEINASAYGMPEGTSSVLDQPELWGEGTYPVVGFADGQPVSCSATIVVENTLYVGWVATLPGYQRKGYGEAVMRKSLELASVETGWKTSWLHATELGLPVYQAMGYETTADFVLCTTQPPE